MKKDIGYIALEGLKFAGRGVYLAGTFVWDNFLMAIPTVTMYEKVFGDDGEDEQIISSDAEVPFNRNEYKN